MWFIWRSVKGFIGGDKEVVMGATKDVKKEGVVEDVELDSGLSLEELDERASALARALMDGKPETNEMLRERRRG